MCLINYRVELIYLVRKWIICYNLSWEWSEKRGSTHRDTVLIELYRWSLPLVAVAKCEKYDIFHGIPQRTYYVSSQWRIHLLSLVFSNFFNTTSVRYNCNTCAWNIWAHIMLTYMGTFLLDNCLKVELLVHKAYRHLNL